MSRGTPHRTIRVPDEVWEAALRKAEQEGTNLTTVIVSHLKDYAKK